jgi:hypothetical protein
VASKKADPAKSAAVQEAVSGVIVHTLRAPYAFEGSTYTSIDLNLQALTGKDVADLQAQWTQMGFFAMEPESDSDFCMLVAGHAAGKVPEFFDGLPAPDYTAITTQIMVFLQAGNIGKAMGGKLSHGLDVKLDGLTGRDLSQVKREWVGNGGASRLPATDLNYCALVTARAASVPLAQVQALPAPQYIALLREVSNFLQP